MAELLLINPRRRRRAASKGKRRSNPSPAQRAARAKFAAAARARSGAARASNPRRRRRRNPAAPVARRVVRRVRRSNPIRTRARRRRNPIGLGNTSSYIAMLKDGFIGGAGALGVDVLYGYLAPYLPASLQRTPGQASVGDAVKAVVTIALGKLLSRPTRGLSEKAAKGALVVQAHGLLAQFLPSTVTLGYSVAAPTASGFNTRIGPNRRGVSMARYTQPGASQMLGAYTQPGATQMLATRSRVMSPLTGRSR